MGILMAGALMFFYGLADKFKLKKINKYLIKNLLWLIIIFIILSPVFFLYVVPEHKYFNFKNEGLNYLSDKLLLKDLSGEIRKQQWRETVELLREDKKWLWGVGLSAYPENVKKYHHEGIFFNFERDEEFRTKIVWFDDKYKGEHWQPVEIYMYPHNLILNFWVELGLLGAILFIWIIIKFFLISFEFLDKNKEDRYIILGLIGSILVLIIHGLVDVPYFKNDLSVMFWLLLAMMGIMQISSKKIIKE